MNQFSPNGDRVPHGAIQVGIRPGPGIASGPGPVQGFPNGAVQPMQGPGPLPQQQAQISAPTLPKGAQPVPLRAAFQLGGMQQQGFMQHPQAALAAPQGQANGQEDVHTIVVELLGTDGVTYEAQYNVVSPVPSRVLGAREVPRQG